jgi:hypothetical protein
VASLTRALPAGRPGRLSGPAAAQQIWPCCCTPPTHTPQHILNVHGCNVYNFAALRIVGALLLGAPSPLNLRLEQRASPGHPGACPPHCWAGGLGARWQLQGARSSSGPWLGELITIERSQGTSSLSIMPCDPILACTPQPTLSPTHHRMHPVRTRAPGRARGLTAHSANRNCSYVTKLPHAQPGGAAAGCRGAPLQLRPCSCALESRCPVPGSRGPVPRVRRCRCERGSQRGRSSRRGALRGGHAERPQAGRPSSCIRGREANSCPSRANMR